MPKLVRQHVGLRELARRAEARAQLVIEREVDVDLLVVRTVERAHGFLAYAAAGLRCVPEQDELRVVPRLAKRARLEARPHRLGRVEDEGHELYFARFVGRLLRGSDVAA